MYCHIHNDNVVDHFRVSTSDSWSCTKSSPSAAFPGVVSKMSSLHPTLKVMPCDSDHPHNWCLEFCSSPGSPECSRLQGRRPVAELYTYSQGCIETVYSTLITFNVNLGDVLGWGFPESVLYLQGDLLYTVKYGMG